MLLFAVIVDVTYRLSDRSYDEALDDILSPQYLALQREYCSAVSIYSTALCYLGNSCYMSKAFNLSTGSFFKIIS